MNTAWSEVGELIIAQRFFPEEADMVWLVRPCLCGRKAHGGPS